MGPSDAVIAAIKSASARTGVDQNMMFAVAKIESGFNPSATNGSSRGLYQFQRAAWNSVAVLGNLPPYEEAWANPLDSALAFAYYLQANARELQRLGYSTPLTPEALYMAHQQGAAGFMELWKASKGLKSTNFVSVAHMLGNPPPDGQPATSDKATFFKRWMAVLHNDFSVVYPY